MSAPTKQIATVKFYNPDKGWGFLALDDGRDLFVHNSQVVGTEPLMAGMRVTCIPDKGYRGPIARAVTRI